MYKNVWATGAHGELEDSLHPMLQSVTVEALDWSWLLVIAAQRRRAAEVATQASTLNSKTARQLGGRSSR